jgi:Flp pilus assembly CpaE family ATPase
MAKTEHLSEPFDRLVEHYEMPSLIERIQNVLDAEGVLTVADYREALTAARNDGSMGSQG